MPAARNSYTRINWINKRTKLNQSNLNKMDKGIKVNNDLAIENANYIDEIFAALIEQLSISYNQATHVFHLSVGSATGANPTTRFNVEKNIEIHTVDQELQALIDNLNDGVIVVSKTESDEDGNNIKSTYLSSVDELTTTFDSVSGSFVLTLRNKAGTAVATRTFQIPQATTQVAGLLTAADKVKINAIANDIAAALATAKSYADSLVLRANLVSILDEATQSLSGLMSATDKTRLDTLFALLGESDDADSVVNKISEVLNIFQNYPEGASIVDAFAAKVSITDIVNNLTSNKTTKPLSAYQGKVLKGLHDSIVSGDTVVGKANKDKNGNVIDEYYMDKENGFALGLVEASDFDPETGCIELRYNSATIASCVYDEDTGVVTFTY